MEDNRSTIVIGSDHGGFHLLAQLEEQLQSRGYNVVNVGAYSLDASDDYPKYAFKVGEQVAKLESQEKKALGLLLCRSGAGMTIAANKVKGIRAVTAQTADQVKHAREHNNANVLSLSADWLDPEQMWQLVESFIETPFSTEKRHQRRVQHIVQYES